MKNFKLFIKDKDSKDFGPKKVKERIKVPMLSSFFSSVNEDFFVTNIMYSQFKESLLNTVEVYSPKDDIEIVVYEEKESTEIQREFLEMGFKKYIKASYKKIFNDCKGVLTTVSVLFVVGLALIIFAYLVKPFNSDWLMYFIAQIGTVLLWQFVGFWAFEFSGRKREFSRLKQLENINFIFKKWE